MTIRIRAATFAVLAFAVSAQGALAGEVRRLGADKGITVTYLPKNDHYCIRLTNAREAERLALRLHQPACKTAAKWAREGVTLWQGGERVEGGGARLATR